MSRVGRIFFLALLFCRPTIGRADDATSPLFIGKTPSDMPTEPAGKKPENAVDAPSPLARLPTVPHAFSPPDPFVTLPNAVRFILNQRGLQGTGLPATFYVPEGVQIPNAMRRLIVSEGVGLYDTALAVITLVDAGRLIEARQILDVYVDGSYASGTASPMELGAYPTSNNNQAFMPFDDDVHYFFDFTNVYGDWSRWGNQWAFWTTHTGPNAWMVNAVIRYIAAAKQNGATESALRPYYRMAEHIGQAMRRLQDSETYGGIRYAPRDTYHDADMSDPYLEMNSENNMSAYVAFRMLAELTGDVHYDEAAHRILSWFQNAPVWTSDGKQHHGLWDASSATLLMGVIRQGHRWVMQPDHPTDSGGTWTISAIGPAKIDELWGEGSAYRMWKAVRSRAGRTRDFKYVDSNSELAGLDYNDAFPSNESLISPEWTAGGLFALQQLLEYYGPSTVLTADERVGLRRDMDHMTDFIRTHPNAYAWGPGHHGLRDGRTGFHWYCPPPEVHAMASIFVALYLSGQEDPNAWWRSHPWVAVAKTTPRSAR